MITFYCHGNKAPSHNGRRKSGLAGLNLRKRTFFTRGNGSQHAIVIRGNKRGLNIEDLAAGQENVDVSAKVFTRVAVLALSAFWILLLITAAGSMRDEFFPAKLRGDEVQKWNELEQKANTESVTGKADSRSNAASGTTAFVTPHAT